MPSRASSSSCGASTQRRYVSRPNTHPRPRAIVNVPQSVRIEKAHARARQILKFSPLVTDAYFHYTPSQIMFAALSIADDDLAGRALERTFGFSSSTNGQGGEAEAESAHETMRGKIIRTIESCKEMLEAEPPERMDDYWGTVWPFPPRLPPFQSLCGEAYGP